MNSEYIKENCCGVLGCRDEFIQALDLQNQLKSMTDIVMNNQGDFIIKLLPSHSMIADNIVAFFMGAEICLVTFSTRVGMKQTVIINTDDFIKWSETHDSE